MTRGDVRKMGTLIGEADRYNNGIYAATTEYYDIDGDIYAIYSPNNGLNYNGEPNTWLFDTKSHWFNKNTVSIAIDTLLDEDIINAYLGR